MTTDSDRISRLEGIAEQTTIILDAIQRGQESLRDEMHAGDAALHAEIQNLRDEMQAGFASLRAEMASNARTTQIVVLGGGATILAALIATYFS